MFEMFTGQARRIVVVAQEEARALDHNYIGTEHLLLGLLRQDEGVALLQLPRGGTRRRAGTGTGPRRPGSGTAPVEWPHAIHPPGQDGPGAPLREAQRLQHQFIGTEHVLLALIQEDQGLAAQPLRGLGLDLDGARRVVANRDAADPGTPEPTPMTQLRNEVARLRRLLERHSIDPDPT